MKVDKNPNNEIFFFRNTESPIVYVYMSKIGGKEEFYELFEFAAEITEETADVLVLEQNHEVVYVGDDHIIEKYFKHIEKKP